jgi:hypothetical protein
MRCVHFVVLGAVHRSRNGRVFGLGLVIARGCRVPVRAPFAFVKCGRLVAARGGLWRPEERR